jgi:hypothetical protein
LPELSRPDHQSYLAGEVSPRPGHGLAQSPYTQALAYEAHPGQPHAAYVAVSYCSVMASEFDNANGDAAVWCRCTKRAVGDCVLRKTEAKNPESGESDTRPCMRVCLIDPRLSRFARLVFGRRTRSSCLKLLFPRTSNVKQERQTHVLISGEMFQCAQSFTALLVDSFAFDCSFHCDFLSRCLSRAQASSQRADYISCHWQNRYRCAEIFLFWLSMSRRDCNRNSAVQRAACSVQRAAC